MIHLNVGGVESWKRGRKAVDVGYADRDGGRVMADKQTNPKTEDKGAASAAA